MIPKVRFIYSWIYDENMKKWTKPYRKKNKKYLSPKQISNYINKIKPIQKRNERKIFQELAKVTGLKWKEKYIDCYLVGSCIPFSQPLTIHPYKQNTDFIDTLTHELIHQLFIQNDSELRKAWNYIFNKYRNKSLRTKIHIPLHAIHTHMYKKFFGEKRLQRDIKLCNNYKDYREAWETVEKEGYKKIINEIKKRTKG